MLQTAETLIHLFVVSVKVAISLATTLVLPILKLQVIQFYAYYANIILCISDSLTLPPDSKNLHHIH